MKIAIRYQSRGGNTKTMAETAAEALGVSALPIDEGLTERTDRLILCGGTYAFTADEAMLRFISDLDPELIGEAVVMVTASGTKHGLKAITGALIKKGITVSDKSYLLKLKGQGLALLGRAGGELTEEQKKEITAFAREMGK